MICRADTIGTFQIESRAQMATLPRMKPARFYDLVVEVAIIRPGPIVGQMVNPYLNRRAGREPVTYPHPSLEPILARTLGVPLFQEQLLRIAMVAAGFSGGEAEELRRAMGFKRSVERMDRLESRLRSGMNERGIVGERPGGDRPRDPLLCALRLSGIPRRIVRVDRLRVGVSQSPSPEPRFWLACSTPTRWASTTPATLVKDAQRHGVEVRPIDVAHSDWRCTLETPRHA